MSEFRDRLKAILEPILASPDPRPALSAYHDMPYAIFHYPPNAEFDLRQQLTLLRTRLEQAGKRVTTISLAECLHTALEAEGMGTDVSRRRQRQNALLPMPSASQKPSPLSPLASWRAMIERHSDADRHLRFRVAT